MPRVLAEEDIDPAIDELERTLSVHEELADSERQRVQDMSRSQDFSDGGTIGVARLYPLDGGQGKPRKGERNQGRPTTRRAWRWDGTDTLLPLAWNPEGNVHDYARRYLAKRLCICCMTGGFRSRQCPNCIAHNCELCHSGTAQVNAEGKRLIIPCYYLRKQDVPFPRQFFGSIDCFLESCIRRNERGFLTQRDMRLHARSRHRMEYQAYQEIQATSRTDEIEVLRRKVDELMAAQRRPDTHGESQERTVRRGTKRTNPTTKPAMA